MGWGLWNIVFVLYAHDSSQNIILKKKKLYSKRMKCVHSFLEFWIENVALSKCDRFFFFLFGFEAAHKHTKCCAEHR